MSHVEPQRFFKPCHAASFYKVSDRTLRRWRDNNSIPWKQLPSGRYVYAIPEEQLTQTSQSRISITYARVSSQKQRDDLKRQSIFLKQQFPNHQLVTDIGSGLNFKRKGLRKLICMVMSNSVEEIVISSKDRLCRYGYELIEFLCHEYDTKIVVLDNDTKSDEKQFVCDILSIIQVYTCKWNGKRRYHLESKKNQITIDIQPKDNAETVERSC